MLTIVPLALEIANAESLGIVLAVLLFVGLLGPFLVREIRKGKAQLRPGTPLGAGDVHPGRRGNPAPGQPDAQADPYSAAAHADRKVRR